MFRWAFTDPRKHKLYEEAVHSLTEAEAKKICCRLDVNLNNNEILHIFEDEFLRLSFRPGRGSNLVIAITGVGQRLGAAQTEEFVKSASSENNRNILFVIDKKRSWFTQPRVIVNICMYARFLIEHLESNEISTLGTSMGGYGAILLTKYLPINNAVAFSPQYSMNRWVVFERRWKEYRKFILRAPVKGLNEAIVKDSCYFVIFGNDKLDAKHKRKFKPLRNLHLFTLPCGGHNPAAILKEADILNAVLDSALEGNALEVSELLKVVGAEKLS